MDPVTPTTPSSPPPQEQPGGMLNKNDFKNPAFKKGAMLAGGILLILVVGGLVGFVFASKMSKPATVTVPNQQNTSGTNNPTPTPTPTTNTDNIPKQDFKVVENKVQYDPGDKASISEPEKLPESKVFNVFSYNASAGKIINVSGTCSDAYFAIVVFFAADDYKKDPAKSVINKATECPASKNFTASLSMQDYNLPSGNYYFFVADQGKTGSWYNPR